MEHNPQLSVSRRDLLIAGASTAAATAVPRPAGAQTQPPSLPNVAEVPDPARLPVTPLTPVTLQVNGSEHRLDLDTRTTLLDALREHLHLTGTKKGCDHGQCGACTVLVNGRRVVSCLSLAVMNQGAAVTTIEGLGTPQSPHAMQAAFVRHDGFQCGYCTPGQICSAVGMLDEIRQGMPSHASEDIVAQPLVSAHELRERMSGNLCRCGAYSNIVDAITEVAGEERT